jgi:hypothetical protein
MFASPLAGERSKSDIDLALTSFAQFMDLHLNGAIASTDLPKDPGARSSAL